MSNVLKMSSVTMVKRIIGCLMVPGFLFGAVNDPKGPVKKIKPAKKIESSINAKKNPPPVAKNNALETLIEALQKHYETTKSATFNFEQSYKNPFLSLTETSKGTVSYKRSSDDKNKAANAAKPRVGKMLWSYTEPTDRQKKFYIDGNKLTYYSARDKTAFRHECYDQDTLSASVAFLLGDGNLKAAFTITPLDIESPNPALSWLTLTPKENNSPVKKLYLGLNKQAQVMESLVEDPSGGKNHFKFFAYKMNPVISDSMFVFTPPPGVKVQPAPNVVCDTSAKKNLPAKNVAPPAKPAPKEPSPKTLPAKKIPKEQALP